ADRPGIVLGNVDAERICRDVAEVVVDEYAGDPAGSELTIIAQDDGTECAVSVYPYAINIKVQRSAAAADTKVEAGPVPRASRLRGVIPPDRTPGRQPISGGLAGAEHKGGRNAQEQSLHLVRPPVGFRFLRSLEHLCLLPNHGRTMSDVGPTRVRCGHYHHM